LMSIRVRFVLPLTVLLALFASAKDKKKELPYSVVQAKTILVVMPPSGSEPVSNPTANRLAQDDVEQALADWGRYRLVVDVESADLVMLVKKGHAQAVTPTVRGGRIDEQPVVIGPGDDTLRVGRAKSNPPDLSRQQTSDSSRPQVGTDVGQSEDMVEIYS